MSMSACACASASMADTRSMLSSALSMRLVIEMARIGPWARRLAHSCAVGSSGINGISQQEQLKCTPHAYNSWQQVTGSHISTRQAHLREEKGKACLFRGDTQVRG